MVCRTTKRERKETINEEGEQKKGKTDERDTKKGWEEKGQSDRARKRNRENERERLKYDSGSMISGLWVFTVKSVCCVIVTVESFCALPPF